MEKRSAFQVPMAKENGPLRKQAGVNAALSSEDPVLGI